MNILNDRLHSSSAEFTKVEFMAAQLFGLSYMLHMYQYFLMLTKQVF